MSNPPGLPPPGRKLPPQAKQDYDRVGRIQQNFQSPDGLTECERPLKRPKHDTAFIDRTKDGYSFVRRKKAVTVYRMPKGQFASKQQYDDSRNRLRDSLKQWGYAKQEDHL